MEGQQGKVWQPEPTPPPQPGHQGSSRHWEPPWAWAEAEPGPTGGTQQCQAVGTSPAVESLEGHSQGAGTGSQTVGPQWGGLGHSSPLPKPTLTATVIPI